MTCSRKNVRFVLNRMIDANADHLFDSNSVVYGRWMRVLKHWWLRGLDEDEQVAETVKTIDDMESLLNWNKEIDADFEDRKGVSLLMYAVSMDNLSVATRLVEKINTDFRDDAKERQRRMESRICKEGFLKTRYSRFLTNALGFAMTVSSPEIVQLLLENGANANATDIQWKQSVYVCVYGRNNVNNVKFWLKEFPDWDLEARNTVVGGIALGCAVYHGS